jgi:hypothetical protein
MKCNETRELMPDLAAGLVAVTPEAKAHLDSCAECAGKLEAFRQTMSLLDEWKAPEPSPYFDVRLRARLREESAKQSASWLQWLRKPVLAASFALVMIVGVSLFRMNSGERGNNSASSPVAVAADPGQTSRQIRKGISMRRTFHFSPLLREVGCPKLRGEGCRSQSAEKKSVGTEVHHDDGSGGRPDVGVRGSAVLRPKPTG